MERTKDELKARRDALTVTLMFVLCLLITLLYGCANVQEWRKVITEDNVKNIKTTEIYYRTDDSFTLGTKGLGDYELIHVEGVGL